MISEVALLDTNILVYAVNEDSPFHKASITLRDKGLKGELALCIAPQILNEFYANVTNRKQVDIPLSQEEAKLEMEKYFHSEQILKIHPRPDSTRKVLEFLRKYTVVRQEIYDLYLVATMLSNNITRIYTYNTKDFSQYPEIEVLNPESVIQ